MSTGVLSFLGDNRISFSAAISKARPDPISPRNLILVSRLTDLTNMKSELVHAASAVVPNQQILVNMVSRRVRQLSLGHRPLVEFVPGLGHADVALMEIANSKIVFEPAPKKARPEAEIVEFPGIITTKKAKTKAA